MQILLFFTTKKRKNRSRDTHVHRKKINTGRPSFSGHDHQSSQQNKIIARPYPFFVVCTT